MILRGIKTLQLDSRDLRGVHAHVNTEEKVETTKEEIEVYENQMQLSAIERIKG
jgi:hypothetical protein